VLPALPVQQRHRASIEAVRIDQLELLAAGFIAKERAATA
jgi:hypothetical protein